MRWPPLAWLERGIARPPPHAALLVFFAPTLLLLPVKLTALWLIGQGKALLGLFVIVVAKIAGTALVARLFHLTQPALMKLGWFARFYNRWSLWKEAMFMRVRACVVDLARRPRDQAARRAALAPAHQNCQFHAVISYTPSAA
jgi:hypothetical protein